MVDDTVNQVPGAPAPAAPAATPAPAAPAPAPAQDNLSDAARTREQFEKLLDSNKRLFEANEALRKEMEVRKQSNQTFDPATPYKPAPQQAAANAGVNVEDFVEIDPKTGDKYINDSKLRAKLNEVQEKAVRAEQIVQNYIKDSEAKEIDRQNRETFAAYPELDRGSGKFDESFNRQVRGVLVDSMINADEYGGRSLSFKEAADFVRGISPKPAPAAPAPADNSGQEAKDQGSAQANQESAPQRAVFSDDAELRGLQVKTRLGDNEALAKRLLHTEHILPKDASLK